VNRIWFGAVLASLTFGLASAGAQSGSPLEKAKTLYDSAAFDEALTLLNNLDRTQPETDVEEVQRYRALCLLALNRTAEAQTAIEVVFSRDPLYKLSEGDAPPRMRAAFNDVRRRLLPKMTEQLYAAAKQSFDRKEYVLAATQFQDLLTFLEDADAKQLPSLKELRTLAAGFHDLSVSAAPVGVAKAPPPTAPAPAAQAAPVQAPPVQIGGGKSAPIQPAAGKTTPVQIAPVQIPAGQTGASERAVNQPAAGQAGAGQAPGGVLQPPVIVKQQMPLWLGAKELVPRGAKGMLRLIIDEQGNVEEARVVQSIHAVYDALLLSAARTWKYEPARLDGQPVRFVKMIEVVLRPSP
jgi:TonB family protein